jgi:hypothetical protein
MLLENDRSTRSRMNSRVKTWSVQELGEGAHFTQWTSDGRSDVEVLDHQRASAQK